MLRDWFYVGRAREGVRICTEFVQKFAQTLKRFVVGTIGTLTEGCAKQFKDNLFRNPSNWFATGANLLLCCVALSKPTYVKYICLHKLYKICTEGL